MILFCNFHDILKEKIKKREAHMADTAENEGDDSSSAFTAPAEVDGRIIADIQAAVHPFYLGIAAYE